MLLVKYYDNRLMRHTYSKKIKMVAILKHNILIKLLGMTKYLIRPHQIQSDLVHSDLRFDSLIHFKQIDSFCKKSAFRFTSCPAVFHAYLLQCLLKVSCVKLTKVNENFYNVYKH